MRKSGGGGDDEELIPWEVNARVPGSVLVLFTRQLGLMLAVGIPLLRCLECLEQQDEFPIFGLIVKDLRVLVSTGETLSSSLGRYPRAFPTLYTGMIRLGETSGQLTGVLERLAHWLERDDALYKRIKQAMTYPAVVLAASVLMVLSLFSFVVPQFLSVLVAVGTSLPWLTRGVMLLSNLSRNPGAWILAMTVGAGVYAGLLNRWSDPRGKRQIYVLLLAVPVLGKMLHEASLARFSAAAEMGLSNGLTLLTTMEMAGRASSNPLISDDVATLRESLTQGLSLSRHLDKAGIYDAILVQLVAVGEESGRLSLVLAKAADYYNNHLDYLVEAFGTLVEPVLLALVGGIVGLIILSVFLPIYSLIGSF